MKIYVASSWRNPEQPSIVGILKRLEHEVYDFRQPEPGDNGFHWSEIGEDWKTWDCKKYIEALRNPIASRGFAKDMKAMLWADVCILVLPCGRSAHLEAGWFVGAGKQVFIYIPGKIEPELMYLMTGAQIYDDFSELTYAMERVQI